MEVIISSESQPSRGKVAYQVVVILTHTYKEYPEAQPEVELLGVYKDKNKADKMALKVLKKRSKGWKNWDIDVSVFKVKVVE